MKSKHVCYLPALLTSIWSTSMADFTPITGVSVNTISGTPDQKLLLSFTANGGPVSSASLLVGTSTALPGGFGTIGRIDDFDLNSLASGMATGNTSVETVLFGGNNVTDANGTAPDFFIFEAGGDPDDITIAAIFPDNSVGTAVPAPTGIASPVGWGNTGISMSSNALNNAGQTITGVCWSITDLKDAGGNLLPAGTTVKGIKIGGSMGIDIGGFYALAPPPAFAKLAVSAPGSVGVDVPFQVTITAQDAGGNTVSDSSTTVAISGVGSNPAGSLMEFDWNEDNQYGDATGLLVNGVKTINARNKKAQTVTLTASAGTATTPNPAIVVTAPGPYAQLQILAPGETAAPGTASGKTGTPSINLIDVPIDFTVVAVDSFWNPVLPVPSIEVDLSSSDTAAILPANAFLGVNGPLFNVTMKSSGLQTVTATDVATSGSTSSSPFTVLGAPVVWKGDGGDNKWDTSTLNWLSGATEVAYADPYQVTFDTNGLSIPAVDLVGTLTPSKITVNATTDYTFATTSTGPTTGSIGGSLIGGFIKTNTGSLTVSTANTYSGPTTVSGGLLIPTNASALPNASALTLSGGLIGVQDIDFVRPLGTGAGQLKLDFGGFAGFGTTGVVNLGGNVTPTPLTMGSSEFAAGGAGVTPFILSHVSATRTIDFQNPIALRNGLNFFQISDGGAAVDAILSGAISMPLGGIGFSKTGDGTLMLSNTGNSFTQGYIDNGTIMLGAAGVLSDGLGLIVKKGASTGTEAVLDLNGFNETLGSLAFGDTGAGNNGTPSVINSDSSTPEKAAAVLTLNGGLTYNAGSLASPYGQATISANLATGTAGIRTLTVNNGSNPEDLVISGALSGGAITKAGAGVLVLTNPIYTGNTTVSLGTLIVRKDTAQTNANPNNDASALTIAAGAVLNLDYVGTDKVASLVIGTNAPLTSGTFGAANFPGVITGTGTITVESDPFITWAVNGAAFDADTNNDGVKNGLAWFLGAANKENNATGLLPKPNQNGGGLVLEFDCLDGAARGTAVFQVQYSSDLGQLDQWAGTVIPGTVGTFTAGVVDFEVTDPAPPGGLLKVVATIPAGEAGAGKLFGRVEGQK